MPRSTILILAVLLPLTSPAGAAADPSPHDEIGAPAPLARSAPDEVDDAPSFRVMLDAGVGRGMPMGGFYKHLRSRISLHARLRIALNPRFYVAFAFRRQQLYRGPGTAYVPGVGGSVPVDLGIDVDEYLVLLGVRSRPRPRSGARTYAEIGGGHGVHRADVAVADFAGRDSLTRFLIVAQLGVVTPFGSSGLGMDLGVSLAAKVFGEGADESNGTIVGVHAALTCAFGEG